MENTKAKKLLTIVLVVLLLVCLGVIIYQLVRINDSKEIELKASTSQKQLEDENDSIHSKEIVEPAFDQNDAKAYAERYLNIIGATSSEEMLTNIYGRKLDYLEEYTNGMSTYKVTRLNYNDFVNKVEQFMTVEILNEINTVKSAKIFMEYNGYLSVLQNTWTSTVVNVENVLLVSEQSGEYVYRITAKYGKETTTENINEMTVKNVDGKFVITDWNIIG